MDDLGNALSSIPRLVLEHWVFLVLSLAFGIFLNVFKTHVWTWEKAQTNRFYHWVRVFLPMHGPALGFVVGVAVVLVMGENAPAGPGIVGRGYVVVYYSAAGLLSAWVVSLFKHFMQSRGISDPYAEERRSKMPTLPPQS